MKKILNTILLSALLTALPFGAMAQNNGGDFFANIGKIYVVVGVLLILFITIIIFLVVLERRLARLEAQQDYLEEEQ